MGILKLETNRVWRTYTGGKKIDEFYSIKPEIDGHTPEVWISSVTEANNPTKIENEGLSYLSGLNRISLKEKIETNPAYYLGADHIDKHGENLGVLVKLLDSSERLTIQVHPDKPKARLLFNSDYGKTEAWLVLGGREIDGEKPHIYFGFKEGITKEKWIDVFNTQNIEKMLGLMNKVYVNPGDIFLIEGGLPHAIGAGCFILEIQEPTDYTIRTEKVTPNGYEIPDNLLHQGLGFEKMFECFDYTGYSIDDLNRWRLKPQETSKKFIHSFINDEDTKCFSLEQITITTAKTITNSLGFCILICLEGEGSISAKTSIYNVKKGDQFFIPAGIIEFKLYPNGSNSLKMIKCLPPKS